MNMKMIVGLYGAGNSGKTTTLNLLIKLFQAKESGSVCIYYDGNENNEIDCKAIFRYHNQIIGITTGGDYEATLKENCDFFRKYDCDVMFTATKTYGSTRDVLTNFAEERKTELIWIRKFYSSLKNDEEGDNLHQAKNLLSMIS
ncbi:MAG: hypothetical protein CVV46_05980 [Spirochaetae bacterium HGW-Spirochaetae-2]|nr:MAG: hypothetical protein CVV46_05980 [Spirochaetae bacterium HGW-Spirochaetae-2]